MSYKRSLGNHKFLNHDTLHNRHIPKKIYTHTHIWVSVCLTVCMLHVYRDAHRLGEKRPWIHILVLFNTRSHLWVTTESSFQMWKLFLNFRLRFIFKATTVLETFPDCVMILPKTMIIPWLLWADILLSFSDRNMSHSDSTG